MLRIEKATCNSFFDMIYLLMHCLRALFWGSRKGSLKLKGLKSDFYLYFYKMTFLWINNFTKTHTNNDFTRAAVCHAHPQIFIWIVPQILYLSKLYFLFCHLPLKKRKKKYAELAVINCDRWNQLKNAPYCYGLSKYPMARRGWRRDGKIGEREKRKFWCVFVFLNWLLRIKNNLFAPKFYCDKRTQNWDMLSEVTTLKGLYAYFTNFDNIELEWWS